MERALPQLTLLPDAATLAKTAADRLLASLAQQSGRLAICLSGGSTPERLYRLLAEKPYRDAMPWDRIHWFWGDERFVPQDDARSNFGAARLVLLDRVPIPTGNLHPIPTDAGDAGQAARLYERELRDYYGAPVLEAERPLFDAVLLGVGADGHTASLFPGHPEIDEKQRWVVAVPHADLDPFVPRVTLTLPTLASTRAMIFLVTGGGKREVLARLLAGEDLPASRAYSHGSLTWLIDRAAAPELSDVT
jgi:6-phosphogluconolactonase